MLVVDQEGMSDGISSSEHLSLAASMRICFLSMTKSAKIPLVHRAEGWVEMKVMSLCRRWLHSWGHKSVGMYVWVGLCWVRVMLWWGVGGDEGDVSLSSLVAFLGTQVSRDVCMGWVMLGKGYVMVGGGWR